MIGAENLAKSPFEGSDLLPEPLVQGLRVGQVGPEGCNRGAGVLFGTAICSLDDQLHLLAW